MNRTLVRLKKDYTELISDNYTNIFAEPVINNVITNGKLCHEPDLFLWKGYIIGPEGTPYNGGKFNLSIIFPKDYPFSPPMITCETKIYHPNINRHGSICIDILKGNWSPILSIGKVLLSLSSMLSEPNGRDPLEPEIADVLNRDIMMFNETAKEWTRLYAINVDFNTHLAE